MEFYGVIGANGVAVMNDWNRVLQASKYLRKITTHKFDTFEEAEDWALTQFCGSIPACKYASVSFAELGRLYQKLYAQLRREIQNEIEY